MSTDISDFERCRCTQPWEYRYREAGECAAVQFENPVSSVSIASGRWSSQTNQHRPAKTCWCRVSAAHLDVRRSLLILKSDMSAPETANAINEVAQRMGFVSFGVSATFVAAIHHSRTAARRRVLLRVYVAVLAAVLLWFIPSFMRAGYSAIAIMLGGATLIFGHSLCFTTFCDSCSRAITNNRPWSHVTNCPHYGAQLPHPL